MSNNLPIYEIKIDMNDELGMFVISLVDEPAVERNFYAFKDNKKYMEYKVINEEKQKVFGLVMAANKPIYRCDNDGTEYYIRYSKETIELMAEKYFKMGLQNNVDTNHNFKLEDGITLTQMFIKDCSKGINPIGFEEIADGSLFAEFHIENPQVWEDVKDGKYKGFSLAGTFTYEKIENEDVEMDEILKILERIKNKL